MLIEHFRQGREWDLTAKFLDKTLLYMSSVVAMELYAGCRTTRETRLVDRFMRPYERTGRVVHPDYRAWLRVGAALVKLRDVFHCELVKRRALANDLLIAMTAVQIGAVVVTNNTDDFRLIQKVTPLRWAGTVQDAIRL